jgi:hypothetical protein
MKLISRLLTLVIAAVVFSFHAYAAPGDNTDIKECGTSTSNYLFALCAASTCENTGSRIAVNTPTGGQRKFKEVKCACPVVNTNSSNAGLAGDLAEATTSGLPSIANLKGGNMTGSCNYPVDNDPAKGVWSLYSLASSFPQRTKPVEVAPNAQWTTQAATLNYCSARLNQGRESANCFSFKCSAPYLNGSGVLVSDCYCPKGEDVFSALPTKSAKGFFTDAGGNADPADKEAYCFAHPVGGF